MLELRTNGCPDCISSAKKILRNLGYFTGRDFRDELHKEHLSDRIYQKRPDYIKIFSGAILYNPDTEQWIDFYDVEHISLVINPQNEAERASTRSAIETLKGRNG